jgi:hypothetical protein
MNSTRQTLVIFAVAMAVALSACTTIKLAPPDRLAAPAGATCRFTTSDLRHDPAKVVARSGYGAKLIDVDPPLAAEIRDRVCRAIGESVPTVTAAFVIYDYECISSMVLFKITFVAEVRGRFVSADGQQFELRQSGEHATYSAFSPSG